MSAAPNNDIEEALWELEESKKSIDALITLLKNYDAYDPSEDIQRKSSNTSLLHTYWKWLKSHFSNAKEILNILYKTEL